MTRPLLPPGGIFVGIDLLFDHQLTPALRDTLLQLMALAWSSARRQTPPVSVAILATLTRKSARTLRAHLASLRAYPDVLRLQPAGRGRFTVILAGWLFGKANGENEPAAPRPAGRNPPKSGRSRPPGGPNPPRSPKIRPSNGRNQPHQVVKEEEEFNLENDSTDFLLLLSENRPKKAARPRPRLSQSIEAELREAGLFSGLLPEVAALAKRDGHSESDLRALLAWCRADEPDRPAALFVGRLRIGARAPREFSQPACPRCGQHGKHSPECPRRYALDEP